ncbi:glycosyltransferase [Candidatus Pseudothioglobus singularis]|nr:glycosyltransferase [Candidatus Pseudothioglobus singularis]
MNILHVIIGLNVGGAENSLKRLIESHKDNTNYQHSVLSLTTIGKVGGQLQASGIEVCSLGLKSPLSLPIIFIRLIKFIRKANPDIVHTWMFHADLLGGLAAWVMRKKVIWSIRNTDISINSGTASTTKYIMHACAFLSSYVPKRIVCVANASAISHSNYGYNEKIMITIANGYDVDKINQAATKIPKDTFRHSLNIAQDAIVIGSVGRYNDYKDYPTFIKTATILLKSHPTLQFLMVGKDVDDDNTTLVQLIASTGYQNNFILLGERDDVPACLSIMDIFCLHSISEGFPNALGEAMSIGLPCVTTDVGDAAMMLENQALVVEHSQPILLARSLQNLLDLSSTKRKQIGKELQQHIKNEYSIVKVQKSYEALYQKVINL